MIVLEKFDTEKEKFEFQALRFAERFGIIEYRVEGSTMIWQAFYRNEGRFQYKKDFGTGREYAEKIEKAWWE